MSYTRQLMGWKKVMHAAEFCHQVSLCHQSLKLIQRVTHFGFQMFISVDELRLAIVHWVSAVDLVLKKYVRMLFL